MNGYKNYIVTALLAFMFGVVGTQFFNHISFEHRLTSEEQETLTSIRERARLHKDLDELMQLVTQVIEQNNKLIAKMEARS